jgi:SAM-dependent methyltransferase
MEYRAAEQKTRRLYDETYAQVYRESDEAAIRTEDHEHIRRRLRSLTASFDHEVAVLDIGCGSGRHFHCLANCRSLVGIDVSPFMVAQAKRPVAQQDVSVRDIDLRCGNIFDIQLPAESFDVAYSLGVLGEHAPFDSYVCEKVHSLLWPGGVFLFTVVDASTKQQGKSLRRRVAEVAYPILPKATKAALTQRFRTYHLTRDELEGIMAGSAFRDYDIDRHVSASRHWQGAHFICCARKAP